jgi:hypothetical protein
MQMNSITILSIQYNEYIEFKKIERFMKAFQVGPSKPKYYRYIMKYIVHAKVKP